MNDFGVTFLHLGVDLEGLVARRDAAVVVELLADEQRGVEMAILLVRVVPHRYVLQTQELPQEQQDKYPTVRYPF